MFISYSTVHLHIFLISSFWLIKFCKITLRILNGFLIILELELWDPQYLPADRFLVLNLNCFSPMDSVPVSTDT